MTSFIQEVIGLITKRRTVKSLDSINDYFLLGRKRDPGLLQSSYNPKMDPYAVKVQDLMCSILQGSGTSSPNYIPVFKLPAPGSTCSVGSLANSVIYQDPATSALKFEGYGQGNFVGSVSRLLAVDTDGNIIETTASGGGGTGPLQDVTDLGNTTTNSIDIVGNDLNLDFTQYVRWSGNVGVTRNNIDDMELNAGSVLTIVADGAVAMPIGLSADRPVGVDGMLRFNTDIDEFEGYKNGAWYTLPDGNTTNTTLEILLGTTTLRLTDSDGNFVQTDLSGLVAGVTTVNGLTGDIVLTPGTNITFNTVGNEITINATDTNTTYSLLLSGTDIQLVGSDGSVDTVPLNPINTTNVSLDFDPVDTSLLVLTDSDGNSVDVDLAAFEPITYTLSTLAPTSPIITLNGSDGSTSSINYAWDGYSYTLAYDITTDPTNPELSLNNGFGPVLPLINLRRLLDIRTDAGTGDVHIQLKNADGTLISESPGIAVGGGGGPVPIIDSLVLTTPDSTPADPNWTLTLTDTQANSVSESMLPLLQSDSYELTAHPTGAVGTPAGPTEIRLTNLFDTGLVDSITLETINYDYNLQFVAPATLRFTETNKLGVDTDIDVDLLPLVGYDAYTLSTIPLDNDLVLTNTAASPNINHPVDLDLINYDYTLLFGAVAPGFLTLRETKKDTTTADFSVDLNGLLETDTYTLSTVPAANDLVLTNTVATPNIEHSVDLDDINYVHTFDTYNDDGIITLRTTKKDGNNATTTTINVSSLGANPGLQEVLLVESLGEVDTLITILNDSPLGSETDIEFGFTNTLNLDSAIVLRGYESGRRDVTTADKVLVIQEDTEGNPDVRTMQGLATVEVLGATEVDPVNNPGVYTVLVSGNPILNSGLVVTPKAVGESTNVVVAVGIISFETNSGSASYRTGTVLIKNLDGSDYTGAIDLHVSYQTV